FWQVPTFGHDTIWCFWQNVSDLKQMAAHDFEDLLQCAIPIFSGLLPKLHNEQIIKLLFVLA
ncbi:hypothetical protein PISMIDRAFT_37028, partial [Pisolithus microcarpus 441]